MPEEALIQVNKYLEQIATELDISETEFLKAEEHYKAIGNWLGGEGSNLAVYSPSIYPQGSFRLGTVVRPIGKDEYDIDLVCHLNISPLAMTPADLKKLVGDRLKQNGTYLRLLAPEKKRCWCLNYAGDFHLDILPSITDPEHDNPFILITEMGNPDWLMSNPIGYANWFAQKMVAQLIKFAEARGANVEQVPIYSVRTPLQRAIQLLKRHRDIRFNHGSMGDDKPISMIITTLAARIYQNEPDIYTTLVNIINVLSAYAPLLVQGGQIEERAVKMRIIDKSHEGRWYIPNPVNPDENFADRWHENGNRKAKAFFEWVGWLKTDLEQILNNLGSDRAKDALKTSFGIAVVDRAIGALHNGSHSGTQIVSAPHVKIESPGKPWLPHV